MSEEECDPAKICIIGWNEYYWTEEREFIGKSIDKILKIPSLDWDAVIDSLARDPKFSENAMESLEAAVDLLEYVFNDSEITSDEKIDFLMSLLDGEDSSFDRISKFFSFSETTNGETFEIEDSSDLESNEKFRDCVRVHLLIVLKRIIAEFLPVD